MKKGNSDFVEYTRHYKAISFHVNYCFRNNDLRELFFTVQTLESLAGIESDGNFIYGKIDKDFKLRIGLKEFQIIMSQELHERMGLLYDEIRNEYVRFINKNL